MLSNMLQIQLTAPYEFKSSEVEIPRPGKGEALLKIRSLGICGSDVQMYHGLHKYMTYPVVIGHEVSAVVTELGEGVQGFKPGDKVTVEPQIVCQKCYPCSIGRFNVCENLRVMGVHADGFCREYAVVGASYLHLCPPDMEEEWLALVEPLAVGVGAVKRGALAYGGDVRGLNVAVVGAGTIGNCVAQAAKAMCAARVLLTDISTARLRFAEECGVEHCAATLQVSLSDAITAVFGSRRADIIVDAVGAPAVMGEILAAARRSSAVVVTGNFKEPLTFEVPVIQRQEIALIGHMMYVKEDFEDAIRFIAEGSVKVGGLVTQRFPAAKLKDAFRLIDLQPHHVMKVLLTF